MAEVYTHSEQYLPLSYNDNRVVLLVRDPHCLYAYWENLSTRKIDFINEFGQDIWEKSRPVLKITNISNNTSFYVRINDFSNNWYINVSDTNSLYFAELGRKVADSFFISMSSSNYVSTPSNSVSSNTCAYFVDYNSLKNGNPGNNLDITHEKYSYDLIPDITFSISSFGISSNETYTKGIGQPLIGISSSELFRRY